jgi:amidophosphoribosyltransferase|tara:strand:+ start:1491 stop:3014 length:1524 start_codon:yes stop_codon:yes gene_type:complete
MCGIVGMVGCSDVNQDLYEALTVLQHRGQDAAGIVTCEDDRLNLRKSNGLVRDVFRQQHMDRLKGRVGIGHCRYPTAGTSSSAEAQPMYVNSPYGIALAHNGNLTNKAALSEELFTSDRRHVNTDSDSEVLLNVFAHELQRVAGLKLTPDDVFKAVAQVHKRCRGAYAAIALITGHGLLAFRDPCAIRPVVFGRRETESGLEYMVASESVALDVLGYSLIRDLLPGEAIYITKDGEMETRQCAENPVYSPCIFEHVYLARPDSIIDGISVYKARLRMGEKLAEQILSRYPDNDIDVVIPIPDTSRTSALPVAHQLDVKYREGFIKNRYIGRTFIMAEQRERQNSVRHKLNAVELEFKGKNVLLVDDSIVRGTTSKKIVEMARSAGAKKVYFASASPPVRYPNVYGIDMPAAFEFIAHQLTEERVAEHIGADWLIYQQLDDLIECAAEGNSSINRFDTSIFDGDYVTGDIDDVYLSRIEMERRDDAKMGRQRPRDETDAEVIDLHNQA